MLKKIIAGLIITGSLLLVSAVFCHLSRQREKYTVIQFACWGSKSEIDILKPLLEDFETQNPDIKIEFMHIPQNYFQKIHLLFASNTSPDVIFINNLFLPVYANAGVLEDLSGTDINRNDFYEKSLESLSWNGKLFAVPRDVSNLVIYYNKDLFKSAGIAYPANDWTFDDFLTAAKKLTHRPDIFGISFEEDSLFYLPYLMSEGGGILSDDLSRLIIDEPASQKGLKFYADLRKKYHVAPQKSESASATMAQMFLQGRLAMHLSGRWLVPKYREEAVFEWDVAPFPKGDAGSVVPMDASGWAISKTSKHKPEALKLIKFLSSKNSIEKLTKSGLIIPARKDCANSVLTEKKPANSQVFIDVINTSKPTPVSVNYNEINDKIKECTEKIFN